MTWKPTLLVVALMVFAATALFWVFQRQMGTDSSTFFVPAEILPALEQSLEDQKRLANLDPENESVYRERFEDLERTTGRLRIVEYNRERLVRRYQILLLSLLAVSVALSTGYLALRHSSYRPRLARVQTALGELAAGLGPVEIGDASRDTLGRISRMIERSSIEIARDRRRLRALRNLSHWQEAARRHAHEIRTPLTSARLALDRIGRMSPGRSDMDLAVEALGSELDRLGKFTEQFTSFARLRPPERRPENLYTVVDEYQEAYANAWQNLTIELKGERSPTALLDREMIRQVLVNLCDNSSKALGESEGTVQMTVKSSRKEAYLELADTGPGIPEAVRERLFEPYATTRGVDEGMGLGLAISRKILLEHGGDLELLHSSADGTTLRLSLPLTDTK
jgi:two-component system nitrogen regulation sensor histidine kinase NtrY